MLSLQLKSGEYLVIGGDVVVQVFEQNGPSFRVEVKAPREVPVVRGSVWERDGEKRPNGLYARVASPSRREHNAKNRQALAEKRADEAAAQATRAEAVREMQRMLARMDGSSVSPEDIQSLRTQLARIAPPA